MKTFMPDCPFTDEDALKEAEERPVPDPYYFERGDHRCDIPVHDGPVGEYRCLWAFVQLYIKETEDIIKGYVEYDRNCSLALVELGRIDRDFGPKAMDDAMISWLDSGFYSENGISKASVDADQWLKNFASYAVTLAFDSPIGIINNWYLATTSGGNNDWRIVQYDHNSSGSRDSAGVLCKGVCGYRQIYWPILHPTCEPMEDHKIVGPILNDESSVQTYLGHVADFAEVLTPEFFQELRDYGASIKAFVVDDPLFERSSEEDYEASELSPGYSDYNTGEMPIIKFLEARVEQVKAQLDAIESGTLPRDGKYGKDEVCPDWRDSSGDDYIPGDTFVEGLLCPSFCEALSFCYGEALCDADGTFSFPLCPPITTACDACFPHSSCGSLKADDGKFKMNKECMQSEEFFFSCKRASNCFGHRNGQCGVDGEFTNEACKPTSSCAPCYPESRCGGCSGDGEGEGFLSILKTLL